MSIMDEHEKDRVSHPRRTTQRRSHLEPPDHNNNDNNSNGADAPAPAPTSFSNQYDAAAAAAGASDNDNDNHDDASSSASTAAPANSSTADQQDDKSPPSAPPTTTGTGKSTGTDSNKEEADKVLRENMQSLKFPFPWKVHEMLANVEKDGNDDVVSWMPSGKAFRVHREKEFVNSIMKTYFNQSKFTSFTRQLYIYGFQKIQDGPEKGGFQHKLFCRDNQSLCLTMRRKRDKPQRQNRTSNMIAYSPFGTGLSASSFDVMTGGVGGTGGGMMVGGGGPYQAASSSSPSPRWGGEEAMHHHHASSSIFSGASSSNMHINNNYGYDNSFNPAAATQAANANAPSSSMHQPIHTNTTAQLNPIDPYHHHAHHGTYSGSPHHDPAAAYPTQQRNDRMPLLGQQQQQQQQPQLHGEYGVLDGSNSMPSSTTAPSSSNSYDYVTRDHHGYHAMMQRQRQHQQHQDPGPQADSNYSQLPPFHTGIMPTSYNNLEQQHPNQGPQNCPPRQDRQSEDWLARYERLFFKNEMSKPVLSSSSSFGGGGGTTKRQGPAFGGSSRDGAGGAVFEAEEDQRSDRSCSVHAARNHHHCSSVTSNHDSRNDQNSRSSYCSDNDHGVAKNNNNSGPHRTITHTMNHTPDFLSNGMIASLKCTSSTSSASFDIFEPLALTGTTSLMTTSSSRSSSSRLNGSSEYYVDARAITTSSSGRRADAGNVAAAADPQPSSAPEYYNNGRGGEDGQGGDRHHQRGLW